MKRYKFVPGLPGVTLFSAVCSMDNLERAHKNASSNKGWYREVKMVNKNPEKYLKEIQDSLLNKTYHTSKYEIFERQENDKVRKIYKLPYYPDRIVQWALLQVIAPIIENTFTIDTYSSIPHRGPLICMKKLYNAVHTDFDNTMYCLKIDIHHFYPSINHDILKDKYARLFKDPDILWLIYEIIDSVNEDEGIPIGNYLSQYSGNFYLTAFDHWVKEIMGVKHYYRYMDDMVFLANDKCFLQNLLAEIVKYLDNEKLTLKNNYQIFNTDDRGIDFVGYVVHRDHVLIRKRIRNHYRSAVIRYSDTDITDSHLSSYSSYTGFLQHANTYNLQSKYGKPVIDNWGLDNNIKTNIKQRKGMMACA